MSHVQRFCTNVAPLVGKCFAYVCVCVSSLTRWMTTNTANVFSVITTFRPPSHPKLESRLGGDWLNSALDVVGGEKNVNPWLRIWRICRASGELLVVPARISTQRWILHSTLVLFHSMILSDLSLEYWVSNLTILSSRSSPFPLNLHSFSISSSQSFCVSSQLLPDFVALSLLGNRQFFGFEVGVQLRERNLLCQIEAAIGK